MNEYPGTGTIVICDFDFLKAPEMVKRRPAIVVSPRLRQRDNLCLIVPCSTTEPRRIMPYHYLLRMDDPLPHPYDSGEHWVKCDMLYTVATSRLNFPFIGKDANGKRIYDIRQLNAGQMRGVKAAILHGMGMSELTEWLV
ncbi:type II toxin-antitoxin system PemK/MazF family toxin [Aquitalea sp. USM4]|uniref:type II toxin-antitoxin system PemK/MazF family toxin n=1 Tax=Aquitalea sp. USM4 TaxID=1590041 RepID=UPI00103A4B72|nr:type II toxin-antitoxin system PemK/MazF family toxin [Aquitalea sp. USM4]QBJ80539.1 type II toxin-antitoxin system PemK/MazF family toxin [Aquitalea sp. USM4]